MITNNQKPQNYMLMVFLCNTMKKTNKCPLKIVYYAQYIILKHNPVTCYYQVGKATYKKVYNYLVMLLQQHLIDYNEETNSLKSLNEYNVLNILDLKHERVICNHKKILKNDLNIKNYMLRLLQEHLICCNEEINLIWEGFQYKK